TVVDLLLNRSLSMYKGAFEKCVWDWLREEKTQINGIYFKETDLTKGWLCGNLFAWAALAKYYKHLSNYTDPIIYTTNGTISDLLLGPQTIAFNITGPRMTTTEVYCGSRGRPLWILVDGAEKPVNYDDSTKILRIASIDSDSSEILAGWEIPKSFLTVNTLRNGIPIISNITLFDENKTTLEIVRNTTSNEWFLRALRTYYAQATTKYNGYTYRSAQISVDLTFSTTLNIAFLFSNLTVTCVDIDGLPIDGCAVRFTREYETHIKYTSESGSATTEAYFDNWQITVFWRNTSVGITFIEVNETIVDININCRVGDLVVTLTDQYDRPIRSNLTLTHEIYPIHLSGYLDGTAKNITFKQAPLVQYTLQIEGEYGTRTFSVGSRTTYVRIEIEQLDWMHQVGYIAAGIIIGLTTMFLAIQLQQKRQKRKAGVPRQPRNNRKSPAASNR
ncbi:MAG: hypothetical protein JSW53_00905, partial [Candidatus Bathyarchaeota archaeon]